MSTMTPVPKDHPLMVAWEKYKATEDYANTRKWALHDAYADGSLWAAFEKGWNGAPAELEPLRERVKELEAERDAATLNASRECQAKHVAWDKSEALEAELQQLRAELASWKEGRDAVVESAQELRRENKQLRAERDELRRVAKLTLDWLTPNPETPIKPSCMAPGRLVIDVLSAALAPEPQEPDATPGSPAL